MLIWWVMTLSIAIHRGLEPAFTGWQIYSNVPERPLLDERPRLGGCHQPEVQPARFPNAPPVSGPWLS